MENKEAKLSTKVVSGGAWLFSFQIFDNLLGIVRLIVLARLLSPSDFGLVGVSYLVLDLIKTFTQTGVQTVLVHKTEIEKYLNTAWTYLLGRGIILYAIVFLSAPFLADFFNSPDVTLLLRVLSITLVLDGLTNIGVVYFQKELNFNKQFMLQITGNIIDCITAVTLAVLFQNVWAIVAGNIVNNIIRLVLSYILSPYRPKLELKLPLLREINSYGKWIFGSSALTFLYSQGDDLLVGKLLGTTQLGYYQIAYRISNLPATQISEIISAVLFPAYSKIKHEKDRLGAIYLSTLEVTAFLSFLAAGLITYFAHSFIVIFLGEKMLPIYYPILILSIWGLLRSIGTTAGVLWQAIGKPDIVTKLQLGQTILMALVIYPLTIQFGIVGTACSIVFASIVTNIFTLGLIAHKYNDKAVSMGLAIFYPMFSMLVAMGTCFGINTALKLPENLFVFIILAIVFIVTFLLSTIFLSKTVNYSLPKTILQLLLSNPALNKHKDIIVRIQNIVT